MKITTLKILQILAITLVAYALLAVLFQMHSNDWPAGDEYWHYSYSERLIQQGLTERASVHNYNSTTPAMLLNVFGIKIYQLITGEQGFNKFIARLPQIFWLLLLFYSCFQILAKSLNREVKWIVLILLSLDANLLAHASLVGTDLPFAGATAFLLKLSLDYWKNANKSSIAKLGLGLGLAFIAKYSATFLFPPLVLLILVKNLQQASLFHIVSRFVIQILVVCFITILIINISYGFLGTGLSFSSRIWYYQAFQNLSSLIPHLPLPLPIDFIAGFDQQLIVERTWKWNGIILGQVLTDGIWYFFILCWILKTPLSLITICGVTAFYATKQSKSLFRDPKFVFTGILFVYFLIYFSLIFRVHVGLRYALMCIPLLYLLVAQVFINIKPKKSANLFLFLLTFLAIWEVKPYFGNQLAFTNLLIWPKENVYQWIADSNVDWNQNLTASKLMATSEVKEFVYNPAHILPGYNLISVNQLAGVYRNFSKHQWARENLSPIKHFGYTTMLYNISNNNFEKFLKEDRTYLEPSAAATICHSNYRYYNLENGRLPVLQGRWDQTKLYTACLIVEEALTVEVKVLGGGGWIGQYPREFNCQGVEAYTGDSLWFKYQPGIHPICTTVSQDLTAEWIVHKGKAKLALRNALVN